jgi:hypothetical protein
MMKHEWSEPGNDDGNGGTRFGASRIRRGGSLRNDSPRDVALREQPEAFALQNRCGAL